MISDAANRLTGVVSKVALQTSAVVAGTRAVFRRRAALVAAIVATLTLALSTSARPATITVDSLADTGAPGICVLRDAITAANTMTATNGCAAGDGHDKIQFSVTGTIALAKTLPQVTDSDLTINELPPSARITIDGGGTVQVMNVASGARLNVNNLTIAHGSGDGGGITNSGILTVRDSKFLRNGSTGHLGGAIYNYNLGLLTIANSIFSRNRAYSGGGAIYNIGTLTVRKSTFLSNSTSGFYLGGGGIFNSGTLTVTHSTFSANVSRKRGGGIYNLFGTVTVTNSTFSGNRAGANVTGERGVKGGGILNNGKLTVTNSTFYANSANAGFDAGLGGAIFGSFGRTVVTEVKSTILAASGSGGNCGHRITDAGYNISDDSSCGFSATGSLNDTDPQFDPAGLSDNGGPTPTIALLTGSPAIDAIPVADCTDQATPHNPIITDQRRFPRPDNGESACDIGAYEFQDAP
jgi:parallel beta helix pectate lyase-like protein